MAFLLLFLFSCFLGDELGGLHSDAPILTEAIV